MISGVDETKIQNHDPFKLVQSLAQAKAEAVASKLSAKAAKSSINSHPKAVLGCDSIFVFQEEIFGKPKTHEEAIERWARMSSNSGFLLTGHALLYRTQPSPYSSHFKGIVKGVVRTNIKFAQLSLKEIKAYVATDEPMECAGGFALEGQGGMFIECIEGCYSNVIGISLPWLQKSLSKTKFL